MEQMPSLHITPYEVPKPVVLQVDSLSAYALIQYHATVHTLLEVVFHQ